MRRINSMKITGLETLCLSRLHERERQWFTTSFRAIKADCAIVVIHTDEGVTGIGEAIAYGWPLMIREWVDRLAPELLGKDPGDPGIAPHPNGLSRTHDSAVAGIDCALWDLKGKSAGKQVSELLAGKPMERVRLYASSGCRYDWRDRPEQLIDEAVEYIELGYTAMKFRLGTEWSWDGVTVDRFLGLVRELHQTVNGRLELMLDCNCRLNEDQAMRVAKELDRLGFSWLEEPIPSDQIDGYARLCAAVDMPITGGENLTTLEQFMPYLVRGAYDIVQPDSSACGLTEVVRIARAADRQKVDVCPHTWMNGLAITANAHLVSSLSNPRVQEMCMIQGPLQWDILAEKPAIEDGWLKLADKPGFGVNLAEDLEERFPYIEGEDIVRVQRQVSSSPQRHSING